MVEMIIGILEIGFKKYEKMHERIKAKRFRVEDPISVEMFKKQIELLQEI